MRTDLWSQFSDLVTGSSRILATVTAHNADGTSSLTTAEGAQIRARGQLGGVVPYNVWVQDGRVVETAPNLPIVQLTV
ncbi:hypothetical protein [Pseudoxanthomonas winnipegensis]|uniref:Uncharacterized protein n=1 Tax=Pseudoxanthomonas winnipegensis TaxID=2480810 RepID=A0A4Q8M5Y6_9GAMM|nr:hypothetical protein [Pseudoxanthomonas winnipegensis]TAA42463.1 hypothetical protein EA655_10550 [Pseudoxanthomonas winnipegensis]